MYAASEVLSYEHRASCVEMDLGSGTGQALIDAGYVSPTVGAAFFSISQVCPYSLGVVTEPQRGLARHADRYLAVDYSATNAAEEILVDEIARALGKDAVAMRRTFLKTDEARAVLNKVANEGNWGRAMSSGTAQGRGATCRVPLDRGMPRGDQLQRRQAKPRVTKRSWHWTWGVR